MSFKNIETVIDNSVLFLQVLAFVGIFSNIIVMNVPIFEVRYVGGGLGDACSVKASGATAVAMRAANSHNLVEKGDSLD